MIGALSYWLFGYAFAYGSKSNSFIGYANFAGEGLEGQWAGWFFQFVFAATAATIVSGAVAERCSFTAYFAYRFRAAKNLDVNNGPPARPFARTGHSFPCSTLIASLASSAALIRSLARLPELLRKWMIYAGKLGFSEPQCLYFAYSLFITGFVYPVVTHWGWTSEGWLAAAGYSDFAGSGIVHLLGGVAALTGAAFLGPRIGRFSTGLFDLDKTAISKGGKIEGHSVPLAALGGFLLVVGFFSFNGGSLLSIVNKGEGATFGKIVANTMLAGSTSGMTSLMLNRISFKGQPTGKFSILVTINGILAGEGGGGVSTLVHLLFSVRFWSYSNFSTLK